MHTEPQMKWSEREG